MKAFIDANVIIKAFTDNPDKEKCRHLLYGDFVTNTLCLVEAQHAIGVITRDRISAADCVKSLFKSGGTIVPLDINLLFESYKRTVRHKLNVFDMIHFVTALLSRCDTIFSYDKDFDNLEIKRLEP